MKTKLVFLVLFALSSCLIYAQGARLHNLSYFSNGQNGRIAELRIVHDSLLFIDHQPTRDFTEREYQILEDEKRGPYHYVYLLSPFHHAMPGIHAMPFGLLVIRISDDRRKLFLFPMLSHGYESKEAAREAEIYKDPDKRYFTTWYSPGSFQQFIKYPQLKDAGADTARQVIRQFYKEQIADTSKLLYSMRQGLFGDATQKDILPKILIAMHLSPLSTLKDLNDLSIKYGIHIPQLSVNVSRTNTRPYIPSTDPETKIDVPASTLPVLQAKDAINQVGRVVNVKGKVYGYKFSSDSVQSILFFVGSANFPNEDLIIKVSDISGYEKYIKHITDIVDRKITPPEHGVYLGVQGRLYMWEGKPTILLKTPQNLGVVDFKDSLP